MVAVEICN